MRDYIELTKPRITWLILMSTGIGYFYGLPAAANWWEFLKNIPLLSLLHTVIGTGLIASGTAALNQWYERDADRKMRRTACVRCPGKRCPRVSHAVRDRAFDRRISWSFGWGQPALRVDRRPSRW